MILALAAVLPGLLWHGEPGALANTGIERVFVSETPHGWRSSGLRVSSASELSEYVKVPPPTAAPPGNRASATSVPWIDANGWRFLRGVTRALYAKLPAGSAALAAAEAYAYGVDAVLEASPDDLPAFARMLAFLRRLDGPRMPALANICVVDDGGDTAGEVMNLLGRRNLLYRVLRAPDPRLDFNYSVEPDADPNEVAARIRKKLGDERRLVRLFGSYTVLAHLTGDGKRARLHLLNYSSRPATDLRVRVLGEYGKVVVAANRGTGAAEDYALHEGGTEFTIRVFDLYAVVDLIKSGG